MKITVKMDMYCPSGFYCMKNANNKCARLRFESNKPYCEVFYPFLNSDSKGNVLKCEACLLAERQARAKE